jgi:hypothetical protein
MIHAGWPRFMKPGTLAQLSEPTVRNLEKNGIIPKRHPIIGAFDSEAVLRALIDAAGIDRRSDVEQATARTLERIRREAEQKANRKRPTKGVPRARFA